MAGGPCWLAFCYCCITATLGLTVGKDDSYVLSCGDDGVVKQWDAHSLKPIEEFDLEAAEDGGNLVKPSASNVDPLVVSIVVCNGTNKMAACTNWLCGMGRIATSV